MTNLTQIISSCQEKLQSLQEMISLEDNHHRVSEIDSLANDPNFWNNAKAAGTLMKERQELSEAIEKISYFREQVAFYQDCLISSPIELQSMTDDMNILYKELDAFEYKLLFNDPMDNADVILAINAGSGGMESANFVSMLLRMFGKYADNNGYSMELLDMNRSEDNSSICIDSVSLRISGKMAFGKLKAFAGVNRLVRISPFSSAGARHTSFAAVEVLPDINDDTEIEIKENDLEISFMRGSGAGGQAINKISSCVRLKHVPTGIIINSRGESSQAMNRSFAMKMLKAKLYALKEEQKKKENEKYISSLKDNAFGSQIISYVLDSNLVKDHRTKYQTTDTEGIMNGNLEELSIAYLRSLK